MLKSKKPNQVKLKSQLRIPSVRFTVLSIVSFFVVTMLSSCIVFLIAGPMVESKAKKKLTVESGSIPVDFGKGDVTMIALLDKNTSYDKYLAKNLTKKYTGRYVKITSEELSTKKYDDLKKYRYVFSFDMEQHGVTVQDQYGHPVRRFYILDRLDGKKYPASFTSGYFSRVMKGYLNNMDAQRLKNKQ